MFEYVHNYILSTWAKGWALGCVDHAEKETLHERSNNIKTTLIQDQTYLYFHTQVQLYFLITMIIDITLQIVYRVTGYRVAL